MEKDERRALTADLVPEFASRDFDEFSLDGSSDQEKDDQEGAHA